MKISMGLKKKVLIQQSQDLTRLFLVVFLFLFLQETRVHPETLVRAKARLQLHQLNNTRRAHTNAQAWVQDVRQVKGWYDDISKKMDWSPFVLLRLQTEAWCGTCCRLPLHHRPPHPHCCRKAEAPTPRRAPVRNTHGKEPADLFESAGSKRAAHLVSGRNALIGGDRRGLVVVIGIEDNVLSRFWSHSILNDKRFFFNTGRLKIWIHWEFFFFK